MIINFDLHPNSISKVIFDLEKIKQDIQTVMMQEFLELCCKWLINKANYYIMLSTIGDIVKNSIMGGWSYIVNGDTATITNISDKAVFVEFGVGQIGSEIPHPNADLANYEYNVNDREYWYFTANSLENVDLQQGFSYKQNKKDGKLRIKTRGSWRVMYAFQAILDARDDLTQGNGEFQEMWDSVKARYIG
jgi:hypothetical protein